jgi:mannose-6-phosphate isomerase-like protein (cupin superfamily)
VSTTTERETTADWRLKMNSEARVKRFVLFRTVAALLFLSIFLIPAKCQEKPHAKVVELDSGGRDYLQLLAGPPESITMKSGLVILAPNKSVGKHTTGQHEELLVVLEGQGEMSFKDGSKLAVKANHVTYCPPETEHNVTNTGGTMLRYVYVVASTK